MNTIIVADLTGANPGSERDVLALLAEHYPGRTESVFVVCRNHQQAYAGAYPPARVRILPSMAHYSQVASFIQREFLDGFLKSGAAVTLLSFHPAVLGLRSFLATTDQPRGNSVHWTRLMRNGSPAVKGLSPKDALRRLR